MTERETTTWIPLKKLVFDDEINPRPLRPSRVKKLVENFDPDKLGVIHVAPRAGSYAVIDGKHRTSATREALGEDQYIECKVHKRVQTAKQADLFVGLNDNAKVPPIHNFMAKVTANEPEAYAINKIVDAVGLKISDHPGDTHVRCVSTLEKIYRGGSSAGQVAHPNELERTLRVANEAWGHTSLAYGGDVLMGIGLVVLRYGGELDFPALVNRLASLPGGPQGLLGRGRVIADVRGGGVSRGVASVVVDLYNKGRRKHALESWD